MMKLSILISVSVIVVLIEAKIFERCELAKELKYKLKVPDEQLATWVCIAHRESRYNSSIVGTLAQGKDHGLFQISDLYWCEHGDIGGACGLDCNSLLDDEIKDDYICARRIFRAHQGLQGDGFRAWAVYAPYCSGGRVANEAQYTNDCFNTDISTNNVNNRILTPARIYSYPHIPYWYHNVLYYK